MCLCEWRAGSSPVRLDRHEDALRAARGQTPRHIGVPVEQPRRHAHLCIQPPSQFGQGWKTRQPQRDMANVRKLPSRRGKGMMP
jgi:hypothetical protein